MLILKRKPCRICGKLSAPGRRKCFACLNAEKKAKAFANKQSKDTKKNARTVILRHRRALETDQMDILWSKATKDHYGHKCEHCGRTENLNSHHIIGRSNFGVRFDYRNCCVLCNDCHKFNRYFSAHVTGTLFGEWIRKKRGEEWHTDLIIRARTLTADRKHFLEELTNLKVQD